MPDQIPLALPLSAGAQWIEYALPDQRTINGLAGLNGDFLALAAELGAARPGLPPLSLPGHLATGLARAAVVLGPRLRLPFALFDLRFRDARYWQAQAASAAAVREAPGAGAADTGTLRFTRNALIFAWHLVQRDAAAARLALGLDGGAEGVIGELPVGALEGLARRAAPALAARFSTRERFWELLLDEAAGQGVTPQRLARVRLLGQQLQGMDAARVRQLHRRGCRSTQA